MQLHSRAKVIAFAERQGNQSVHKARKLRFDEKQVRDWRSKSDKLHKHAMYYTFSIKRSP